jgi:hypothetical protein
MLRVFNYRVTWNPNAQDQFPAYAGAEAYDFRNSSEP